MALSATSPLGRLLAGPMRPGELIWIGLRPARRAPVITSQSATLIAETGIEGDRYKTNHNGARQVTLIAEEDLAAIASFLGLSAIPPELVRRNFVTRGINLTCAERAALPHRQCSARDIRRMRAVQPDGRGTRPRRL